MESVWLVASVGFLVGTLVGGGLRPVWRRYVRGQPARPPDAPPSPSAGASPSAESVSPGDTGARSSTREEGDAGDPHLETPYPEDSHPEEPYAEEPHADGSNATSTLRLSQRPEGSGRGGTDATDAATSLPVYLRDPLRVLRQTFRYDDIGAAFDGNERPYTFRMVSDFMEPEIPRHAQVLATPTDQFRDDAVYAFRLGDTFYIARVMRLPDWRLRVLPANDAYRPFTLSLYTADIAVLGRVFAVVI